MTRTLEVLTLVLAVIAGSLVGGAIYKIMHHKVSSTVESPTQPVPLILPKSQAAPALGAIVRLVSDKGKTFCSGSVVSDQIVITAGHCVATETIMGIEINTDPIEVRASDGKPRGTYGRAIYYTPQLDHAVLKGNFKIYNKFNFNDDVGTITDLRDPKTNFVACGYPMGGPLWCTIVHYQNTNFFMWSVDGVLVPGMSGGPVLTPEGTQIGINDAVDKTNSIISPIYNIRGGF